VSGVPSPVAVCGPHVHIINDRDSAPFEARGVVRGPAIPVRVFESRRRGCLCYICAMRLRAMAAIALLWACTQAQPLLWAQTSAAPAPTQQDPAATSSPLPGDEFPQPHITVANPAPAPATSAWPLPDRIAWGANVLLALLGYAGIMLAVSTLRKIERQTRTAEITADAALAAAEAAQASARAILDAERPWILVTPKPSPTAENSFTITATNRGRSPARILASVDRVRFAADETQLPEVPDYDNEEAAAPMVPIFLLPGESTALKLFSRIEARNLCVKDEDFKRLESWEAKIYIHGKIIYRDLIAPANLQTHQTDWCCWYIHGRQKSGLVVAGPSEYNKHT